MTIDPAGAAWFVGNVSALSFTDRTPAPKTLTDAYEIVQSHESTTDGRVDHSKLSPLAYGKKVVNQPTGKKVRQVVEQGVAGTTGISAQEVLVDEMESVEVPDPEGRDLSIVISAQAMVIKDLIRRIEEMEGKKTS